MGVSGSMVFNAGVDVQHRSADGKSVQDSRGVNAATTIVYFPMLFLSGATIPYELFPTGLQKVADVLR